MTLMLCRIRWQQKRNPELMTPGFTGNRSSEVQESDFLAVVRNYASIQLFVKTVDGKVGL